MGRFLFEMLINYNLVKKFPTFEETQIFFNAFTKACDLSPAWARLIQSTPPSYWLKIHFNFRVLHITSKRSLSVRFPH